MQRSKAGPMMPAGISSAAVAAAVRRAADEDGPGYKSNSDTMVVLLRDRLEYMLRRSAEAGIDIAAASMREAAPAPWFSRVADRWRGACRTWASLHRERLAVLWGCLGLGALVGGISSHTSDGIWTAILGACAVAFAVIDALRHRWHLWGRTVFWHAAMLVLLGLSITIFRASLHPYAETVVSTFASFMLFGCAFIVWLKKVFPTY